MPSTQLTFFGKMAILITLTIAFAFAYSLVFFVGLCALIGPVGTFGNLSHMYVLFVVGDSACDAELTRTGPSCSSQVRLFHWRRAGCRGPGWGGRA